jgi:hypothetical protein
VRVYFVSFSTRNHVVQVPNSVPIIVVTGHGSVTMTGINRSVSIGTGQGYVTVIGARGSAKVTTGQARVPMRGIVAPLVNTSPGQGDITVVVRSPP